MIKFIIIGNGNAAIYKEIFPYIKENKMWLVMNYVKEFIQPNGEIKKFGNICWFTNIPNNKNQETLVLTKTYNPIDYPKYDNYDAIEVSKVKDIPIDYDGVMGVPITFLDKYCNSQFEIIWTTDRGGDGKLEHLKNNDWKGLWDSAFINGSKVYKRIFIKKNAEFEILGHEHDVDGNGTSVNQFEINGKGVYKRLLIRKIK